MVVNLSSVPLLVAAQLALSKGLNYAVAPAVLPTEDIITGIEKAIHSLADEAAEEIRQETFRVVRQSKRPKDNLTRMEKQALRSLQGKTDLTGLPADKGNATVILATVDYSQKMASVLDDPAYKKLAKDPTETVERKTTALIKKTSLPQAVTEQLRPRFEAI
jgi:hypothetical protein